MDKVWDKINKGVRDYDRTRDWSGTIADKENSANGRTSATSTSRLRIKRNDLGATHQDMETPTRWGSDDSLLEKVERGQRPLIARGMDDFS